MDSTLFYLKCGNKVNVKHNLFVTKMVPQNKTCCSYETAFEISLDPL